MIVLVMELFLRTSVSDPIVSDNLHAAVSFQIGEMQNALTSAEESKIAVATDWISITGLKLEIRMFFQNALNLLKSKMSGPVEGPVVMLNASSRRISLILFANQIKKYFLWLHFK